MKKINKILICGLGATGGYYASKFYDTVNQLRILVTKDRLERYNKSPRIINGIEYSFEYILPDDKSFTADLIIIATKSNGFIEAVDNINNFVGENTILMSFLNGITSEKKLIEKYKINVVYSYLLGHTYFRNENVINHDGNAKIIFGSNKKNDKNIERLKNLFEYSCIPYEVAQDIIKSQWQKFCFNCCVNQISALSGKTFGEIKSSKKCLEIIEQICHEVALVAQKEGIQPDDFYADTIKSLDIMLPDGKTSMLQDIEAGRKPEIDLFSKTVLELGKKYGINTPINELIYDELKKYI